MTAADAADPTANVPVDCIAAADAVDPTASVPEVATGAVLVAVLAELVLLVGVASLGDPGTNDRTARSAFRTLLLGRTAAAFLVPPTAAAAAASGTSFMTAADAADPTANVPEFCFPAVFAVDVAPTAAEAGPSFMTAADAADPTANVPVDCIAAADAVDPTASVPEVATGAVLVAVLAELVLLVGVASLGDPGTNDRTARSAFRTLLLGRTAAAFLVPPTAAAAAASGTSFMTAADAADPTVIVPEVVAVLAVASPSTTLVRHNLTNDFNLLTAKSGSLST
mmetsp:Transcript_46187/g.111945  ORF Transcript_46187/g.111945 Transcript_46187/m.111945 type:complete len:282 (+) Transcript_46187:473-1318(+)